MNIFSIAHYIWIFIMIIWGAAKAAARSKLSRKIIIVAAGFMLIASFWRARDQLRYWRNDGALFGHLLVITPNDDYVECLARFKLGLYLHQTGRLNEAMDNYRRVIRIEPDNFQAHVNLGNALDADGRIAEAANEFRTAVRLNPHNYMSHYNLGCELIVLGQRAEAIQELEQALQLKPDFLQAEQRLRELGVPLISKP